ncbi:MAG: hypothetical protein WA061_05105 [Microgenomates group bacterium]
MSEAAVKEVNPRHLSTPDLLKVLKPYIVLVQAPPAGARGMGLNTKLVADEEHRRLTTLEAQEEHEILQELWRFEQTRGEIIFTEGEVSPTSYRAGYHADNMTFGSRIFQCPSESLNKQIGPWFDEFHSRVENLHPKNKEIV